MLGKLHDQPVASFRLRLETSGRTRFFDQQNFALYLIGEQENESEHPVFRGLYNAGRPSIFVPAWIDGEFVEDSEVRGQAIWRRDALTGTPLVAKGIAEQLGTLIPPGGRLWFAYEAFEGEGEGDLARETRKLLADKIPLAVTPLGFLLFSAGCWVGLRDWDIPEGGREGPRKLQGNKPNDRNHAQLRAQELSHDLESFLNRQDAITDVLRERANAILSALANPLFGSV